MDSLSLYWNVGERGYAGEERNSIQSLLKGNIAETSKKTDYLYCTLCAKATSHLGIQPNVFFMRLVTL